METFEFKQWNLVSRKELNSLEFVSGSLTTSLGDYGVLVRLQAASLNRRDILIVKGLNPFATRNGVVPGSDGAGVVVKTGKKVTEIATGDRVATTFMRDFVSGQITHSAILSSLGASVDGVFRQYGIFPEHALVKIPGHLSLLEGSTFACAGVTAWNSIHRGRQIKAGSFVLIQGTAGVSLFALQFAVAAGATVICTTSSDAKCGLLESLGAMKVLNYATDPNWGQSARSFTQDGEGFDVIVEVGGSSTIRQSLIALKLGGTISLVGNMAGKESSHVSFDLMEVFAKQATIRSIGVGNRHDFIMMLRTVEEMKIKPVIDMKIFKLEELVEAYQYMADQKHLGKITIDFQ